MAPDTPGTPIIRFHGKRASDSDDAIDRFGARRQIAASAMAIRRWDLEQVFAAAAEQQSSLDGGEIPCCMAQEPRRLARLECGRLETSGLACQYLNYGTVTREVEWIKGSKDNPRLHNPQSDRSRKPSDNRRLRNNI